MIAVSITYCKCGALPEWSSPGAGMHVALFIAGANLADAVHTLASHGHVKAMSCDLDPRGCLGSRAGEMTDEPHLEGVAHPKLPVSCHLGTISCVWTRFYLAAAPRKAFAIHRSWEAFAGAAL